MNFGDCFIHYTYRKTIELVNESNIPARYEVQQQDASARSMFEYASLNPVGVIEPNSSTFVEVELQIKRLGASNFPLFVHIIGHRDSALAVDIFVNGNDVR